MAKRTVIESDLSGQLDAETVTFGLEGKMYEIDLTEDEKKKLEQALQTYVKAGREAAEPGKKRRYAPETTAEEREEIREWAHKEGYELAHRGLIPKKIQKAYDEAHGIERTVPETLKEKRRIAAEEREEIREWARKEGYEVAARGQVPKEIQKAYNETHDIKRGI